MGIGDDVVDVTELATTGSITGPDLVDVADFVGAGNMDASLRPVGATAEILFFPGIAFGRIAGSGRDKRGTVAAFESCPDGCREVVSNVRTIPGGDYN